MSCLCIGGVCIPYAGLIPLLLFALKWVAAQLPVGLLPDFVATRLGLQQQQQSEKETSSSCAAEGGGSCCASETKKPRRRTARESSSTATTASTTTDADETNEDEKKEDNNDGISGGGGEVEHIDALTRWTEVFTQSRQSSSSSLLFVKFTAEWCKPCRVIQPAYTSLAAQYPKYKFVTVDVDGDDCDALSSKLRVAMMPTFICFRSGGEVGRMSGGNNPEGLKSWVEKMSSS